MHSLLTMLFVIFYMGLLAISKAYVNVALYKPTYQQSQNKPRDDRYDARNAVDGRKYCKSWSDQCASSRLPTTATWWVKLSSIHSIHHITIYFKTDIFDFIVGACRAKVLLGFSVYVSNTTDRSQGTLCFKDNNFTINTIPPVFTTNCFVHGQYVIYYNERLPGVVYPDDYNRFVAIFLCEVEVYVCPEGFYGVACNKTCGNCRDVNQCDQVNGTCLTGCDAGYWGSLCKTACSHGFFGYDCSERCLDTCAGCNNITGLCDSGCKPGWEGYFCNKGIRYFTKRLRKWSSLMQTNLQIEAKED